MRNEIRTESSKLKKYLSAAILGVGMALSHAHAADEKTLPPLKQDKPLASQMGMCAATYVASARLQKDLGKNADDLVEQGVWFYDGGKALSDEPYAKSQFLIRNNELQALLPKASMTKEAQIATMNAWYNAINAYNGQCEQLRAKHEAMLKPYID